MDIMEMMPRRSKAAPLWKDNLVISKRYAISAARGEAPRSAFRERNGVAVSFPRHRARSAAASPFELGTEKGAQAVEVP
jgi:hypothetical protein